nr:hypothetical protein [Arthrobacter sp. H14-L1]
MLSRMALDGVRHPVHLHYPASGADVVRALLSVATGGIDLRLHPHGSPGLVAPGLEVRPLHHRIETYGYRLAEPDGRTFLPERLAAAGIAGPDVGRLQRTGTLDGVRLADVSVPRPGQRFAFVMDTAPCAGAEELSEGADLLVAECTFSDDDVGLAEQYRPGRARPERLGPVPPTKCRHEGGTPRRATLIAWIWTSPPRSRFPLRNLAGGSRGRPSQAAST